MIFLSIAFLGCMINPLLAASSQNNLLVQFYQGHEQQAPFTTEQKKLVISKFVPIVHEVLQSAEIPNFDLGIIIDNKSENFAGFLSYNNISQQYFLLTNLATITHSPPSILRVLVCHEIGHLKKRHMLKNMRRIQLISATTCATYLTTSLLLVPVMKKTFPKNKIQSLLAREITRNSVNLIISLFALFTSRLACHSIDLAIKRQQELEADQFAIDMGCKLEDVLAMLEFVEPDNFQPNWKIKLFYSTHPRKAARKQAIINYVQQKNSAAQTYTTRQRLR